LAILLFRAASSAYGSIAGLVALGAFGLNLLTPRLATLVRTDMPLALVIFLIGLLIWKKIQRQHEWNVRDRLCLFALLTISMLIKGPIVYAFLLPGIALFQWRGTARPPGAPACSAWSGWWPWIASLAVFLLWVGGGILFQPGFYNEVVMREFLGRFGETIYFTGQPCREEDSPGNYTLRQNGRRIEYVSYDIDGGEFAEELGKVQ
jgi:4-amino-4-deoxy-L-arabinose transferase-like glycosyltransferase